MKQLMINHFPSLSYAGQEAFNTLCTNLTFCGENVKKIMITSCQAAEGKSFAAMNIMRTLAQHGKRVALVDADMRTSSIASQYDLCYSPPEGCMGLAHLLAGTADEDQVIYATNIEGACMVPMGKPVASPLALLNSPRFSGLVTHLAETCDYVLIDTPPVGTVIDAAVIAKACDGIVVVVDYDQVHRQELTQVRQQLEQTGCPVLGAVINRVAQKGFFDRRYYRKAYRSGYGDGQKHQPGKKSPKEHNAPCNSENTTAP